MRKALVAFAGVLLFSAGLPAVSAADVGGYVGFSLGQSKVKDVSASEIDSDFGSLGLGTATTVDQTDTTWKFFGGYRINRNFAVEGAYTDFGEASFNTTVLTGGSGTITGSWSGYELSVSALGIVPIGEKFELFGRLGLGLWDLEFDVSAAGVGGSAVASESESGVSPLFGIGALFKINEQFGVRAEWEHHMDIGDDGTTGKSDMDMISLGLQYRF